MHRNESNNPEPKTASDASPLQRGMSFLDFVARRIAAGLRATFATQPVGHDEVKLKPKPRRRGKRRRDR